ncbi:hypothetical protein RchiOBHm_Chr6g0286331 [Rosa chinensis]|uniref:Uncharacterized protein n=1 Tax=Rosa chinensis TaxID=74649 RepID=A0A2P6PUS7_ROSCH|nr:hypothetical protein RchiOBHm_Chr6g0286331 [Rosa chinensis]
MVVIRVGEVGILRGIEFDGDKLVLGQLGGVEETQIAARAAESLVVGGEGKRHAIAGGGGVKVGEGEGEGEAGGEGGGDVGVGVGEAGEADAV